MQVSTGVGFSFLCFAVDAFFGPTPRSADAMCSRPDDYWTWSKQ